MLHRYVLSRAASGTTRATVVAPRLDAGISIGEWQEAVRNLHRWARSETHPHRVHANTSGTTRSVQGQDNLDGGEHCWQIECLDPDLSHARTICLWFKGTSVRRTGCSTGTTEEAHEESQRNFPNLDSSRPEAAGTPWSEGH